ncbi:MAG: luciferase [Actinomycetia bacterium]|nr:luciferase [Actinomycetes bacterium]
MKFSMIFEGQVAVPNRENERQVFLDAVDQAVLADEVGFHRVWAVEHHALKWFAHNSAPEVFLTWVAARTSRVRVGHAVVCAPFTYNHPVRVAERAATLDLLSGGRVDVGVGRGATVQELGTFGVDPDVTLDEMVELLKVLPGAWRDGAFEYHSDHLDIPPRDILPKPLQSPHPPLFMACSREETLNLAGSLGVGALALSFAGPDDMALKRKAYDQAVAARDPKNVVGDFAVDHLAGMSLAVVLHDRDLARNIGLRGQRFFTESIQHWYTDGPEPRIDIDGEDNEAALRERAEAVGNYIQEHGHQMPGYDLVRGGATHEQQVGSEAKGGFNPDQCYGNVDDAIDYVQQMVDAGVDELMFTFQMGTVPHEICMESIANLGRHVLPHFAE